VEQHKTKRSGTDQARKHYKEIAFRKF